MGGSELERALRELGSVGEEGKELWGHLLEGQGGKFWLSKEWRAVAGVREDLKRVLISCITTDELIWKVEARRRSQSGRSERAQKRRRVEER